MQVYDEKLHKYFYDGDEFVSVTTYIESYFPKFRRIERATEIFNSHIKQIEYEGKTSDEILELWDLKATTGTAFHEEAETYLKINTNQIEYETTDGEKLLKTNHGPSEERIEQIPKNVIVKDGMTERFSKFWNDYTSYLLGTNYGTYGISFDSEMKLFSPKYKIAGTADCIIMNPKGEAIILDWKHCKGIYYRSFNKNPDGSDEKGYHPYDSYINCNYSKYSIQLNLYRTILEQSYPQYRSQFGNKILTLSPKVIALFIVHFKPGFGGYNVIEVEIRNVI